MSKTILAQVDGFTPIIDKLLIDTSLMTAIVFGRMWRYCQMKDGVCNASLEKIAEGIGIDRTTVIRHIKILVEKGYLEDMTPNVRNRPHIYRDTGKAGLYIGVSGVAQNNTSQENGVAQNNRGVVESDTGGVAQSDLKIVSFKKEEKKEEFSQEFYNEANKIVDHVLDNELQAQTKKSWRGREHCNDAMAQELLDVLYQEKRIEPVKSQLMDWIATGCEWAESGFIASDVRAAIAIADQKGIFYNRPGGLTNTIARVAGLRRMKQETNERPKEEGFDTYVINEEGVMVLAK